jgi:uncharacterized membrane protein
MCRGLQLPESLAIYSLEAGFKTSNVMREKKKKKQYIEPGSTQAKTAYVRLFLAKTKNAELKGFGVCLFSSNALVFSSLRGILILLFFTFLHFTALTFHFSTQKNIQGIKEIQRKNDQIIESTLASLKTNQAICPFHKKFK